MRITTGDVLTVAWLVSLGLAAVIGAELVLEGRTRNGLSLILLAVVLFWWPLLARRTAGWLVGDHDRLVPRPWRRWRDP